MARMYLIARVPNEGAHRLAWVIGTAEKPDEIITGIDRIFNRPGMVDRLLAGEVTPARAIGNAISALTRGAIQPRDWYRPTSLAWFEPPAGPRARAA